MLTNAASDDNGLTDEPNFKKTVPEMNMFPDEYDRLPESNEESRTSRSGRKIKLPVRFFSQMQSRSKLFNSFISKYINLHVQYRCLYYSVI